MKVDDPLVSVDWLKDHLAAPDVQVVDATWVPPWTDNDARATAKRLYAEGHIPGAVHFDIDDIADTDTDLPHMLPQPEKFTSRVRKLGLGDGNRIVVYDRANFMASARVWWMFRVMGHEDVRVLDGGWNAWTNAGGSVEDLPPVVQERHFTTRVQNHLVRNYEQITQAINNPDMLILDARSEGRFEGHQPEPRAGLPSGHMPNAVNTPASSLINSDCTLKSAEELSGLLGPLSRDKALIASCGSGVSAAVILLALHRLGRDDVALYDGSWTDYASRPNAEIVSS